MRKNIGVVLGTACLFLFSGLYAQDPVFYEEFDDGMGSWWVGFQEGGEGTFGIDGSGVLSGANSLMIEIVNGGTYEWSVQALGKVNLEQDKTYNLYFQAISDVPIDVAVVISQQVDPWATYARFPHRIDDTQVYFGPYTWKCNRSDGSFDVKWTLGRHDNVLVFIDSVVVVEHVDTAAGCCPDVPAALPRACVLGPNYPNPFNPSTTIPYLLSERADVSLDVYDLGGRFVRTLVRDAQGPGAYQAVWDGTDRTGRAVSSGVYLCRLTVDGMNMQSSQSLKLFLMR